MRNDIAGQYVQQGVTSLISSEAIQAGSRAIPEITRGKEKLKKYIQALVIDYRKLASGSGVLMLIAALGISAAFEAPYALRLALLFAFVLSYSVWAAKDVVPDVPRVTNVLPAEIGFGIATAVLAIGVAGSFIMRDANIWLLGALAVLVITKALAHSDHRNTVTV